VDAADFAPALIRIQERPPPPLAGWTLRVLIALLAGVLLWSVFGQLDIVAVAEGKLVPSGYLKIVQPAEQGIVKEILVREGEAVKAGQVLARMDPVLTDADLKAHAAKAGLDAEKFNSCFDSHRFKAAVDKDIAEGNQAGVSGTPAFFINGRALEGAQPFEAFKRVIDEELAAKKK